MELKRKSWMKGAALAAAAMALVGCAGGGGDAATEPPPQEPPPPPAASSKAYNGPGSKWDVELNDDGTFHIDRRPDHNSDIDLTVDGTWEQNALGFILMTVTSASGNDAPSPGDHAWAVQAEGYALMLYTGGDRFVPMVKSGACPTDDLTGNWVIARNREGADAASGQQEWFGSFAFDAATGAGSLPARHALTDGFPAAGATDLPGGNCSDGIMEVGDALMYLTDNGGAIVHTNLNQPSEASFIFALAQKQLSAVTAFDAEYAGILFDSSVAPGGSPISPVSVNCSQGICAGAFVTDVAAMTTAGEFTVDLFGSTNAPITGFLTGQVRDANGNAGNIACMIDEDVQSTGQSMLSCVGQAPADNSRMFNMFLTSNP